MTDKRSADVRPQDRRVSVIGDLDTCEHDVTEALLKLPASVGCSIYFNSSGGSAYSGLSLATLLLHRRLRATGIVLGECSSATLLILAACQKRLVAPWSTLLFHPLRWMNEEHMERQYAQSWAKHFSWLETELDDLLCRLFGRERELILQWTKEHRFVTGQEMIDAGLAEPLEVGMAMEEGIRDER